MATENPNLTDEAIGALFTDAPDETAEVEPVEDEVSSTEVEDEAEQGDDTDDTEVEEISADGEDLEEMVEIEVDGELLEVPSKYKDYFLRQADYTKKTQEIAATNKQLEVVRGEIEAAKRQYDFANEIQPDMLKISQLERDEANVHQYLRDNIDNLSHTDIEKLRMSIDDSRKERDKIINALQSKQQEYQHAQQQAHQELLNKGTEVLRQKIPGWGEAQQKQVREYALASGFAEQEIQGVVDPRQVETLWKAAQYDSLKQGAAPAVKRLQKAPQIKTKARNPMPKETQDKLSLRKKLKNPNTDARQKRNLVAEDIGARWG
jgi:rRNA maturation endonuclease Nob1